MPVVCVDGVHCHVDLRGAGHSLVLLHGFTGSSRSWSLLADELAPDHRVASIDLIGHGKSDAPPDEARYQFDRTLDDLAAIARQLDLSDAAWLGYSMGGRVALGMALRHPYLVSSLVLESASPGIADPGERSKRARDDALLADRIEREGIHSFVDSWERLPMWQSQSTLAPEVLASQREIRLQNRSAGLAGSLRGMGAGAQPSLWELLGTLHCPVLLVAGDLDAKFAYISERMAEGIPQAELCLVPDAGHAVHLEQPERFLCLVRRFLATTRDRGYVAPSEERSGY